MSGHVTDYIIIKFMTLKLPSFLGARSDEYVAFEIMALVRKNLLNQMGN